MKPYHVWRRGTAAQLPAKAAQSFGPTVLNSSRLKPPPHYAHKQWNENQEELPLKIIDFKLFVITYPSMLNTGTSTLNHRPDTVKFVRQCRSLSWFGMVLGVIFSLNNQLLNVTAYDTSDVFVHNSSLNESIKSNDAVVSVPNKEFVPVFELVLGTITYLVSPYVC